MRWDFTIYPSATMDTARLLQLRALQDDQLGPWLTMHVEGRLLQMGCSLPDLSSVYAMARCMLVARGLKDSDTTAAAIVRDTRLTIPFICICSAMEV